MSNIETTEEVLDDTLLKCLIQDCKVVLKSDKVLSDKFKSFDHILSAYNQKTQTVKHLPMIQGISMPTEQSLKMIIDQKSHMCTLLIKAEE